METLNKNEIDTKTLTIEKKQEELNLFFYRVIHDIKAPIASLLGLINLMKEETKDQKTQGFLNDIENYLRTLNSEISSNLNSGIIFNENISTEEIDFKEMVPKVISLLTASRNMTHILIDTSIEQSRIFKTNRQLIFSIFQNIIDNAIKHGRDSDNKELTIFIHIKQQKGHVKIKISDDGIGITEKSKKNILEEFNVNNNLLTKGNGLGLYIIKKCVEKLQGHLFIDSKQKKGTTFEICIPEL